MAEQSQTNWTTIASGLSIIISSTITLITVWKSYKKDKPSLAVLRIRKKGQIARVELQSKTNLAKLYLELETIEKEIEHEAQLNNFTTGLKKESGSEIKNEVLSGSSNLLDNLKNQGQSLFKEKTNQIKENISAKIKKTLETDENK